MSTETPVLERNAESEEVSRAAREAERFEIIRKNYANLMNPDMSVDDLLGRNAPAPVAEPVERVVEKEAASTAEPAAPVEEKPYLVENARADSYLFDAASEVNRAAVMPTTATAAIEEEDSEDLRPTATTIQYKTIGVEDSAEEGKIFNAETEKRTKFNKRDKIIVAVVISVIVALFALIIINSAIISNISNDMTSLQSDLINAKAAFAGVNGEVADYLSNGERIAKEFAVLKGLVK